MRKLLKKITKVIQVKNNSNEQEIKNVFIEAQQIIDRCCITKNNIKEIFNYDRF